LAAPRAVGGVSRWCVRAPLAAVAAERRIAHMAAPAEAKPGRRRHIVRRPRPGVGWRPTARFALVAALTAAWVAFSVIVSTPWRGELESALGPVMGWLIPLLLAYIPGLLIGFMFITLLTVRYRAPKLTPPAGSWPEGEWPAVTLIVAAWNEEAAIVRTLDAFGAATYEGPLEVVLADNNSTDRTAELAEAAAQRLDLAYRRVFEAAPGKHHALNAALATVTTPLTVTVDADTILHPQAIPYLIARIAQRPQDQHCCACAGALVVANSRTNFLTRMQGWDYRLGINGIKRMQAAYNTALVAQGAFSAYWTDDVRAAAGWPDAIGEDIVLTWALLRTGAIVQYEPCALGFTVVPERLHRFTTQRSRWARGMFEGLRRNPPHRQPRVLGKVVAGIDYLVPFLDLGYVFFWIPGVVLFLFGYPLIFSWWSMLVIPITLTIYGFMRWWQERYVFRALGVHAERDGRGYAGYLFVYQAITSPAALRGYWQFARGATRRWK
jgi:poly-beta-1,6-N-acetyl-D-glucosamine synthase